MKKIAQTHIVCYLLLAIFTVGTTSANAAVPYAYEPMTGSDGAVMNGNPGSLTSNGFTGNWIRVQATKKPNDAVSVSTFYKSGLTFAYPTNSKYLVPSSNTAAASDWSAYELTYAARQLSSPISFDSAGTYYMSFLMNVAGNSSSHGSAMTGLIETLTTSSADAVPQSLLTGYTYTNKWTVDYQAANAAVWNDNLYDAVGSSVVTGNVSGSSWFVLTKYTTAATGNDRVQVKSFAPSDTLPANDASITWDVDYSTPITGVMRFAAAQLEFQSAVDELRFATSYVNAVGLPEAPTIGTPTIAGPVNKGITSNIQLTSNSAGKVRFLLNGKRIPNCLAITTTGTAPNFTATCPWKPPIRGLHSITAQFTSSDSLFTDSVSPAAKYSLGRPTTTR